MVVGVLLAVVGGVLLSTVEHWEGDSHDGYSHDEPDTPQIAIVFNLIVIGLIAGCAGAVTYFTSKSRYAPPESATRQPPALSAARPMLGFEF